MKPVSSQTAQRLQQFRTSSPEAEKLFADVKGNAPGAAERLAKAAGITEAQAREAALDSALSHFFELGGSPANGGQLSESGKPLAAGGTVAHLTGFRDVDPAKLKLNRVAAEIEAGVKNLDANAAVDLIHSVLNDRKITLGELGQLEKILAQSAAGDETVARPMLEAFTQAANRRIGLETKVAGFFRGADYVGLDLEADRGGIFEFPEQAVLEAGRVDFSRKPPSDQDLARAETVRAMLGRADTSLEGLFRELGGIASLELRGELIAEAAKRISNAKEAEEFLPRARSINEGILMGSDETKMQLFEALRGNPAVPFSTISNAAAGMDPHQQWDILQELLASRSPSQTDIDALASNVGRLALTEVGEPTSYRLVSEAVDLLMEKGASASAMAKGLTTSWYARGLLDKRYLPHNPMPAELRQEIAKLCARDGLSTQDLDVLVDSVKVFGTLPGPPAGWSSSEPSRWHRDFPVNEQFDLLMQLNARGASPEGVLDAMSHAFQNPRSPGELREQAAALMVAVAKRSDLNDAARQELLRFGQEGGKGSTPQHQVAVTTALFEAGHVDAAQVKAIAEKLSNDDARAQLMALLD